MVNVLYFLDLAPMYFAISVDILISILLKTLVTLPFPCELDDKSKYTRKCTFVIQMSIRQINTQSIYQDFHQATNNGSCSLSLSPSLFVVFSKCFRFNKRFAHTKSEIEVKKKRRSNSASQRLWVLWQWYRLIHCFITECYIKQSQISFVCFLLLSLKIASAWPQTMTHTHLCAKMDVRLDRNFLPCCITFVNCCLLLTILLKNTSWAHRLRVILSHSSINSFAALTSSLLKHTTSFGLKLSSSISIFSRYVIWRFFCLLKIDTYLRFAV